MPVGLARGKHIRYSTSAVGSVKVEVQDAKGEPIPGYTLEDSEEIYGDEIEGVVEWKGGDLGHLAGQPIRLRRYRITSFMVNFSLCWYRPVLT